MKMKKALALVLAASMALGSVGFVSANPTTTAAEVPAGLERIVESGAFGVGGLRLEDDARREELTAIVLRLNGISDDEVKAADEKADFVDLADWNMHPWIGMAVKEGFFAGDAGTKTFRPNEAAKYAEVLTVLMRALGYTAEDFEGLTWPEGYVEKAVEVGLEVDENIDPLAPVKREVVAYAMEKALDVEVKGGEMTLAQKLGIEEIEEEKELAMEVEAIGAKKLEVTFNQEVDTEKAELTVKKGTISVNTDKVEFAEDKKSAVITTTTNLTKGDYTVTVEGVSEEAISGSTTVENEKVAAIELLSSKAPRVKGNNKQATVSYEVLNQYGEKMTGQTVTWTVSTGQTIANSTGTLTITAANDQDFVPGATVYLTGVHASSATVINDSVEIALAAQENEVVFKGVYNTAKEKLENLPAGFEDGKYVLLFEVEDQYGNIMDSPDLDNLVFTSNNPMFVSATFTEATDVVIDDVTYKAVNLLEGTVSEKGGTVTIQVISALTGKTSSYTIEAEALATVKTFTMAAPSEVVAEGEKVEIPFTALDQNGNAITDFKSLDDKITFSPVANLELVEQDDGSAKLVFTAPLTGAEDNMDLPVYLTSLVSEGGNFSSLMVNVKEEARPVSIIGLNAKKATSIAKGNKVTFKAEDLIIQDQYGRTMEKEDINIWIDKKDDSDADLNSIVIDSKVIADTDTSAFTVSVTNDTTDDGTNVIKSSTDVVTIATNDAGTASTEAIKFTLSTDNAGADDEKLIGTSAKSITFTKVEKSAYEKYEVEDLGLMYINTDSGAGATHSDYVKTVKVYGILANGTKVELPKEDYVVETSSKLVVPTTGETNTISDVASPTNEDGYVAADFEENGNYKDVKVDVLVSIKGEGGTFIDILEKELVLSNKEPKVAVVTLKDTVKDGKATVKHTAKAIDAAALKEFVKEVKDQYGVKDTTTEPTITITNLVKTEDSNFTVVNNGSSTAKITNAEMGDKFTATFKYGDVSVKVNFTVGLENE